VLTSSLSFASFLLSFLRTYPQNSPPIITRVAGSCSALNPMLSMEILLEGPYSAAYNSLEFYDFI